MKNAISDAFNELAKHKDVDKITVKDIVGQCNISRQTFYYHFQDIMEVMDWAIQQENNLTLSRSLEAKNPQEAMRIFVFSAMENHALLQKLLHSQRREQIEKMVVLAVQTYLEEMLRNKKPDLPLNYADMEMALHFYSYGIAGLLLGNCGKENLDEKRLANQILLLLTGKLIDYHFDASAVK